MLARLQQLLNTLPDRRVSQAMFQIFDQILPNSLDNAITANSAGTQADAVKMKVNVNFHLVTTVGGSGYGVRLPPARVGAWHMVKNSGANSMQVFGDGTDTIEAVATATGVPQPAGEGVLYWCSANGNYVRVGPSSATGVTTTLGDTIINQITGGDAALALIGLQAAQGGTVTATGGTSTTATNAGGLASVTGGAGNTSGAGGEAKLVGGTPGTSGIGGAATVVGGAGGSASGAGGAATLTGGAATTGATAGGAATVAGGASTGAGVGGVASLTGGAASAATGTGGAASVVGGAGNTSGLGGAVAVTGGIGGNAAVGGAATLTGGAAGGGATAGGAVTVTGGVSTGSGTGGVASLIGGAGSAATGVGGAVVIAGGAGNTSGAGGQVGITGGAGGNAESGGAIVIAGGAAGGGNKAGGLASLTGGVATGTGVGGVASVVGGVGGTGGATGKGGSAKLTGGASVATDADGGAAIVAGGAKNGGGFIGPVVLGNAQLMPIWYPQAAPMSDAADTPFTATVAQLVAGLLSMTPTTGRTITLPTGAEMDAGVAFADVPATFGFDFTVQNRAAFAATDDIITLAAGASGMTVTGTATVAPGVAGRFRAVRTTTATWIIYKIAG